MEQERGECRQLDPDEALRVLSQARNCAFGPQGVDLPAQVRRRVKSTLAHEPIFIQAGKKVKEGNFAEAERLYRQCLEQIIVSGKP